MDRGAWQATVHDVTKSHKELDKTERLSTAMIKMTSPFCLSLPSSPSLFFLTLWTIAYQAPLSMGFFSGKNTGVVCHFLFQGILLTQGSNSCLLCLLHRKWILYLLSHWGSPILGMGLIIAIVIANTWALTL